LRELGRLEQVQLLQETIEQQRRLPVALVGSPAYRDDGQSVPYICSLITLDADAPLPPTAIEQADDTTSEE